MLALVAIAAVACVAAASPATSPAFFWSPQAVAALSSSLSAGLTSSDLTSLVGAVCGRNAATPVEALLLFTIPHFTTSDFNAAVHPFAATPSGPLASISSAMSSAASSASFPYSSLSGAPLPLALTRYAASANIPLRVASQFRPISQNGASASAALTNGVCDVVVVPLPRAPTAADADTLATIVAEVNTATQGSFVVGVVAQAEVVAEEAAHAHVHRSLLNGKKTYVYMTPNIFAGLLIGLLMSVTALVGVCCLCNIKTPTVFCSEALPLGKEF